MTYDTSEISTPLEIAVVAHFYVPHGTKSTPIFLPTDGEASWSLLPSTHQAAQSNQKTLFLYRQGDRPGLRKPKKGKHQHLPQLQPVFISLNLSLLI